jgi:hypothetical protein
MRSISVAKAASADAEMSQTEATSPPKAHRGGVNVYLNVGDCLRLESRLRDFHLTH